MKKFLLATGILAASANVAASADMRMPVKAPPPVAIYNWTGWYVGGNIGYSWGRATTEQTDTVSNFATLRAFSAGGAPLTNLGGVALPLVSATVTTTGATTSKANVDGFVGGAQFGYNWQFDRYWLLGFEADFQGSAEKGSADSCSIAGCPAGAFYGSADHHLKWFGTVRGKLGWLPHERVVLYATGGLAYGHLESDYISGVIGGTLLTASRSTTRAGWTVGGGVEGAIDRNWTIKLEYLYMDLGSYGTDLGTGQVDVVSPLFACPGDSRCQITATTNTAAQVNTKFIDHVLRAGFNYRF